MQEEPTLGRDYFVVWMEDSFCDASLFMHLVHGVISGQSGVLCWLCKMEHKFADNMFDRQVGMSGLASISDSSYVVIPKTWTAEWFLYVMFS